MSSKNCGIQKNIAPQKYQNNSEYYILPIIRCGLRNRIKHLANTKNYLSSEKKSFLNSESKRYKKASNLSSISPRNFWQKNTQTSRSSSIAQNKSHFSALKELSFKKILAEKEGLESSIVDTDPIGAVNNIDNWFNKKKQGKLFTN